MDTVATIILSLLCGTGVFLVFFALAIPRTAAQKRPQRLDHELRQAGGFTTELDRATTTIAGSPDARRAKTGTAEAGVLHALISDISRKIGPVEQGGLRTRLVKSGWVFSSEPEYHFRRMYYAIMGGIAGAFLGTVFNLTFKAPLVITAVIVTVFSVVGFTQPDAQINAAIKARRRRLFKEMGFGLEKIVLYLDSGQEMSPALIACENMGLFGKICDVLSRGLASGESLDEAILKSELASPSVPQLRQFFDLVKAGGTSGKSIVDPLRAMADLIHERMQLDIIEAGNATKLRVTIITSSIILIASLLVTLGPMLIVLMESGAF